MIAHKDGYVRIENETIGLEVETSQRFSLRAIENKATGRYYEISEPSPATIVLSAARQRIPIVNWRMNLSSPSRETDHLHESGYLAGFHRPESTDDDWYEVEFPYGVRGVPHRYEGYAWFRRLVDLPADGEAETIAFLIGGYDQHDWNEYWIYLNGELIGHRLADSYWREPAVIELKADDEVYAALRFGQPNLIALQTCNLDRARPDMRDDDVARYMFNSSLADQLVTIGPPYHRVSEFELLDWSTQEDGGGTEIRGRLQNREHDLAIVVHYQIRDDEPVFRKWIEIENVGVESRLLLDVVVLEFTTNGGTDTGDRGYPVYIDGQLFAGVEHPAGINQGTGSSVRLWHCPGKQVSAGQRVRGKDVVVGASAAGEARQAFLEHLLRNGQRKPDPYAFWDSHGLNDFPLAPTWEEQVVREDEMLRVLDWMEAAQRKYGKLFDYFILDVGWQDHSADLTKFHEEFWPNGPARVVQRVRELGMKFGLWFACTNIWSCQDNSAVKPSFAPGLENEMPLPTFVPEAGPPGRTFSHPQLCPASEPYRSIFRNAILHHFRENEMRLLKIDNAHYVCHSSSHDHLPGKYSTESMMDAVIGIVDDARETCPDIFVMWYWGHASPFWALFGSTIFESGVRMEASNVSDYPNIFYRDSVTTHVDEGTWFADQIPPIVKDSLGVWIGNVQWANFMGKDGWRNAWIADLCRGSVIAQLWGNVFLFDDDDAQFLGETLAWFRKNADILGKPLRILGDPWLGEPYGNLHVGPDRAFIIAHNPTYEHRSVALRLDGSVGLNHDGAWQVSRIYPDRAEFAKRGGYREGDLLHWWLRPFEVALLQLERGSNQLEPSTSQIDPSEPPANLSRPVHWAMSEGGVADGRRRFTGRIDLPAIEEESTIGLVLRFWQRGAPWRGDYINERIEFSASIEGQPVAYTTVPAGRVWGPSNWLGINIDAPIDLSGKVIEVRLEAKIPGDVELAREGWLVPSWWTGPSYRIS